MHFYLKSSYSAQFQVHVFIICSTRAALHELHGLEVLLYVKQAALAPPCLRQLPPDWLAAINRRFKQQVGGASVLTARAVYLR